MKANQITTIIVLALCASLFFVWYSIKHETKIKKNIDTIIIGTNAEYPPYTFIKDNKIVGFDIDLVKELFKRLKIKTQITDMSWTALIPALQLGQIHIIAAGMTATPERAKHAIFTKPYIKGDPLLIVSLAKNPPIKNVETLKNKKVIVDQGYTADIYMSKMQGPKLLRTPSPVQGFLALTGNRADAYVIAKSSAQQFFKKYDKNKFNIFEIKDASESYSLAISKKYPKLLNKIQNELDNMSKDGAIKKLKTKWSLGKQK